MAEITPVPDHCWANLANQGIVTHKGITGFSCRAETSSMCINQGLSRKSECRNAVRHHASLDYFEMMQLSPPEASVLLHL